MKDLRPYLRPLRPGQRTRHITARLTLLETVLNDRSDRIRDLETVVDGLKAEVSDLRRQQADTDLLTRLTASVVQFGRDRRAEKEAQEAEGKTKDPRDPNGAWFA